MLPELFHGVLIKPLSLSKKLPCSFVIEVHSKITGLDSKAQQILNEITVAS
jgi:hypothetical protein